MAQRSTEKRRFKEVFRRAPQEMVSLVRVQLGEPKQKPITIVVGFCFVFLFLCIQVIDRIKISIGTNINEEQFCKVKSDFIVNHHNLTNKRSITKHY